MLACEAGHGKPEQGLDVPQLSECSSYDNKSLLTRATRQKRTAAGFHRWPSAKRLMPSQSGLQASLASHKHLQLLPKCFCALLIMSAEVSPYMNDPGCKQSAMQ